ncbi:uncharacterized protein LOC142592696 isoform X2 [Dermacentor variabilis]|uniref:uncharacterized protein LOC142592696 isoform X2 n=1 Tax=Dermacentor variabilis TaxID=34621 RepID=UPI003F5BECAE
MKLIKRAHRQERSLAKHLEKNKDVPESLNKGTRDRRQELAGGCQDVLNFQGAQVVQVAAAASPEEDDEEQITFVNESSAIQLYIWTVLQCTISNKVYAILHSFKSHWPRNPFGVSAQFCTMY